jgi:hypothetical protein
MRQMTVLLALVQTLLVVLGFFALGIVLKASGYPDFPAVRWNPLAVVLREHGFWLLILPFLWVLFATAVQRLDRSFFTYRNAYVVGIVIAVGIILLFLYASVFPYTLRLI